MAEIGKKIVLKKNSDRQKKRLKAIKEVENKKIKTFDELHKDWRNSGELTVYDLTDRISKVACIGFGIFGGAVSNLFAKNGCKVVGRMRNQKDVDEVNNKRTFYCKLKQKDLDYFDDNGIRIKSKDGNFFTKDFKFNDNISATTSIDTALDGAEVVLLSPKTSVFKDVIEEIKGATDRGVKFKKNFLILSKGVSEDKNGNVVYLSDLVKEFFPDAKVAVIGGLNYARNVLGGVEKQSTSLACEDFELSLKLEKGLNTKGEENRDLFKVHRFRDIKAIQFCGIFKNVAAIVCGIARGLGVDEETFNKLYSKAREELKEICIQLNLDPDVVDNTCAGRDDMDGCCRDGGSRNFGFGKEIGLEKHSKQIVDYMEKEKKEPTSKNITDYYINTDQTVEGLSNVKHLLRLSNGKSKFANFLNDVVNNNYSRDTLKEKVYKLAGVEYKLDKNSELANKYANVNKDIDSIMKQNKSIGV